MVALFRRGIIAGLLSLLSIGIIFAQTANCPELVNQALLAVDDACSATGRNEACYGYDQVEASFLSSVADDYFASPSDLAPVADIETIKTAPLNTETGTWGVALLNLQADLPNTIPGQNVTFILLGDVEVENAVAPETAFVPSDGVEVTIASAQGANVRSGPGQTFNVVGGLRDGETVMADGLSEDGQWLRIAYRERPAWLSMIVIDDSNPALRDLPTLSADLQTPMQAFYLRTGIGEPQCEEAPNDSLLVQGPENIEVTINVNGASIRLGSSGSLRVVMIDGEPFLEISVYDGAFEVGDVTIRRGQRSIICLGDENSRGLDGENNDLVVTCDPSSPEPFDLGEWCNLEAIPAALLNYPLDVPCPGETPPPTAAGQTAGGGATASQIAGVDCRNFSLISPLSSVNAGTHTFSWTPVTGENIQYQLVFYNYEGLEVESFFTSETSYTVNLGSQTSTGGSFYWEVRAYQNGAYACVSFRSPALSRTDAGGSLRVYLTCANNNSVHVNWEGLPAGQSIQIVWNGDGSGNVTQSGSSGSYDLSADEIYGGGQSYYVVAGIRSDFSGFSCY
jgi:hypothetical protein